MTGIVLTGIVLIGTVLAGGGFATTTDMFPSLNILEVPHEGLGG